MSNFGGQNPYQYGQQPPQGMGGGFGQPQYGGMPAGPPGMNPTGATPPPARRGGSGKALPIMVAAGLAVGVCGGLLLVVGTPSSDAATDEKVEKESPDGDKTAETPDKKVAADEADAKPEDKSDALDKKPEEPKVEAFTLSFDVDPASAKISVDGEALSSDSFKGELPAGESKKVAIEISASGYETQTVNHTITKTELLTYSLKKKKVIKKRPTKKRPTKKRPTKKKKPRKSGGLLD